MYDRSLNAVEAALAALAPSPPRLDRDRLLFEAGRAASGRRSWLWPAAAAGFGALALVLGLILGLGPDPAAEIRYVLVPAPQAHAPALTVNPLQAAGNQPVAAAEMPSAEMVGYLRARELVTRLGLEALPSPAPALATETAPPRAGDLLLPSSPRLEPLPWLPFQPRSGGRS